VRRTVATLLVVASPLLMAVPVAASEGPNPAGGGAIPAVLPALPAPMTAAPAAPAPLAAPAAPAVTAPAVPAALPAALPARAAVRAVVRPVRAKAPTARDLGDAAYAARLQADLCQARTIFCGLDRGGRYPTR